jgi:hypothetical protein
MIELSLNFNFKQIPINIYQSLAKIKYYMKKFSLRKKKDPSRHQTANWTVTVKQTRMRKDFYKTTSRYENFLESLMASFSWDSSFNSINFLILN